MTEKPKKVEEGKDEHFPRIDATPEQLAKALLKMPPLKDDEWEYMKKASKERRIISAQDSAEVDPGKLRKRG